MNQHSETLSQSRAAIVARCATTVQAALENVNLLRAVKFDEYVVKFNHNDILSEGDTQAFLYGAALETFPNSPRIPKIYDCFSYDYMQYLVIERIDHPTVEEWLEHATNEDEGQSRFEKAYQAVAKALDWLFNLPVPVGAEIGMIDGTYIQTTEPACRERSGLSPHPFFGADYAPYRYTNASALERHINKALTYRPKRAPPLRVNMADEELVMVPAYIRASHFLIDPQTMQVTLINSRFISALPRSFVSFTLHQRHNKFAARLANLLDWKFSDNNQAMSEATVIYHMASNCFGLDKNGFPKAKCLKPQ